jgi:uncharacterized damage-inducible protein DinB
MKWKELLKGEVEYHFAVTENLFDLVEDGMLNWKPETGRNWMTTGQLLKHITESCGMCFKGFVTGDWGMPEGMEMPDGMQMPTAEQMTAVSSVAEAKQLLADDKQVAFDMLDQCSEERLDTEPSPAPWDSSTVVLGYRLKQMVDHLFCHKNQLFYYLKLMGKPVDTGSLWGM